MHEARGAWANADFHPGEHSAGAPLPPRDVARFTRHMSAGACIERDRSNADNPLDLKYLDIAFRKTLHVGADAEKE